MKRNASPPPSVSSSTPAASLVTETVNRAAHATPEPAAPAAPSLAISIANTLPPAASQVVAVPASSTAASTVSSPSPPPPSVSASPAIAATPRAAATTTAAATATVPTVPVHRHQAVATTGQRVGMGMGSSTLPNHNSSVASATPFSELNRGLQSLIRLRSPGASAASSSTVVTGNGMGSGGSPLATPHATSLLSTGVAPLATLYAQAPPSMKGAGASVPSPTGRSASLNAVPTGAGGPSNAMFLAGYRSNTLNTTPVLYGAALAATTTTTATAAAGADVAGAGTGSGAAIPVTGVLMSSVPGYHGTSPRHPSGASGSERSHPWRDSCHSAEDREDGAGGRDLNGAASAVAQAITVYTPRARKAAMTRTRMRLSNGGGIAGISSSSINSSAHASAAGAGTGAVSGWFHWPSLRPRPLDVVPPFRFAVVEEGVYRGAYPVLRNFPFLDTLRLRTILQLTPEQPTYDLASFASARGIELIHIQAERYKGEAQLLPTDIGTALSTIINVDKHPVYVHCLDGRHVVGLVIMALRKLMMWDVKANQLEYLRFAKSTDDEVAFVTDYTGPLTVPARVPAWLWGGSWADTANGGSSNSSSCASPRGRLHPHIKFRFPSPAPATSADSSVMGGRAASPLPATTQSPPRSQTQSQQQQQQPLSSQSPAERGVAAPDTPKSGPALSTSPFGSSNGSLAPSPLTAGVIAGGLASTTTVVNAPGATGAATGGRRDGSGNGGAPQQPAPVYIHVQDIAPLLELPHRGIGTVAGASSAALSPFSLHASAHVRTQHSVNTDGGNGDGAHYHHHGSAGATVADVREAAATSAPLLRSSTDSLSALLVSNGGGHGSSGAPTPGHAYSAGGDTNTASGWWYPATAAISSGVQQQQQQQSYGVQVSSTSSSGAAGRHLESAIVDRWPRGLGPLVASSSNSGAGGGGGEGSVGNVSGGQGTPPLMGAPGAGGGSAGANSGGGSSSGGAAGPGVGPVNVSGGAAAGGGVPSKKSSGESGAQESQAVSGGADGSGSRKIKRRYSL